MKKKFANMRKGKQYTKMINYEEFMIEALSSLLEKGENLYYPFYGALIQKRFSRPRSYFGFFGLTENCLLIATIPDFRKDVSWSVRVPLDIKRVKIKKCWTPGQYVIRMHFNEGNPCKIRASKKLFINKISCQEENVTGFLKYMETV